MSTTKPWGGVGAWALDAERAEAEERDAAEAAASAAAANPQVFPSLKEAAAAVKPKKKKTIMPLSVFTTGTAVGPGTGRHHASEPRGLTTQEMLYLPTGPKERSAEELEQGRLGGGFRSYGMSGGRGGRRDEGGEGSWGQGRRSYGGGFDDDDRRGPPGRMSDSDLQTSRADEADNWATGKKSFAPAPLDSGGRHDRYQSLGTGGGGGGGGGPSKADELDNWNMGKKPLPSRSSSGFGSGFRDNPAPVDSDHWVRGKGGPLPLNGNRERPRLVLDPPKGDVGIGSEPAPTRPSPFGAARPREDVLAEKGLDWRKVDSEIVTKKTSRPTSSNSSRPSSAHSNRPETESPGTQSAPPEVVPRSRPKVNPFGDAKPRETVLLEHGKDWRKIDLELEHRGVARPETEEEKLLKEEINHLKMELSQLTQETEANLSEGQVNSLREQVLVKERDLELLISDLDDKVRFGQRAVSDVRPGSGAGRAMIFPERPPSQSGRSEELRNMEFMERPHSRGGTGDAWNKSADERRAFQAGRDGGFFGNRNPDRPRSRERW